MPRWFSLTACIFFGFIQSSIGQQLPIRSYTPADGLPSSFIQHVLSDSRGYLWISTRNGLARFDGYQFHTYSTEDGLSHATVNYVLQSRAGDYWVATNGGGVCQFLPKGNPRISGRNLFQCYPVGKSGLTNRVNFVLEDHSGRLWTATDGGVFVKEVGTDKFQNFPLPSQKSLSEYGLGVLAILKDRENTIWIRTSLAGLFRILPNGYVLRHPWQAGDTSWGALQDRSGKIWMSAVDGVQTLATDRNTGEIISSQTYPIMQSSRAILQTSDGLIWIATDHGLSYFDGKNFRSYSKSDGLTSQTLSALTEDKDGNLWIGTQGTGLMKLTRKGFLSYSQSGSEEFGAVHSIVKAQTGQIYVITGNWLIHRFEDEKYSTIRFPVLKKFTYLWNSNVALLDSHGEWWVTSDHGLLRFSNPRDFLALKKSIPKIYTVKDGLAGNPIFRIYEDSHGDLWISSLTAVGYGLTRWDRQTNTFHRIDKNHGFYSENIATSFLDDHSGNLWIGYDNTAGLVRYRNGLYHKFLMKDGLPGGMITALYSDHAHRLWIATNSGGLARVDQPSAEKMYFRTYTKKNGLSANDCRAITEDRWGRIYVGTVHGVDQLDPVSGKIHHYTMADGLHSDFITTAYSDQNGELWFGTHDGLSRLKPQQDSPPKKVQALLMNVSLAGSPYPLSELGELSVSGIRLSHNRNQIQISFGAINFSLGENLRFQYKLEGVDEDWNAPTADHSVRYASLNPGSYRFMVRAMNESGVISAKPAIIEFVILKPLWLQWWFLALCFISAALLIHSFYRIRITRLLELERLRTRIASDLHDDIGSSLSRIAVLSDSVRRRIDGEPTVVPLLSNMAEASREAIDAISDIVWTVNPNKDHLQDLEQRMRRVAGEMLANQEMEFDCSSYRQESYILNPDFKRNVFLIFKESLHNVVRHSSASKVHIRLEFKDGNLFLEIQDNGQGFDSSHHSDGQGLKNMRKRAAELKANLEISTRPQNGTIIRLQARVDKPSVFGTKSA